MDILIYVVFLSILFRPILFAVVEWDHKRPIVVPVGIRRGHRYLVEIDSYVLDGVAVAFSLNEVTFSRYEHKDFKQGDGPKQCVNFETQRGGKRVCGEFYLAHRDFYHDVTNATSPKLIGTYYTARDLLIYKDHRDHSELKGVDVAAVDGFHCFRSPNMLDLIATQKATKKANTRTITLFDFGRRLSNCKFWTVTKTLHGFREEDMTNILKDMFSLTHCA
ncbi:hypothetical protein DICVIV_03912 [Dictyocaulus viviparus]|uniref:Uncharacterized protein n=1 Tax=Dictyocaulus viviparus TaxID=29172 RepID=A0A0D8XZS6_DICVI|nr:hypothetical protein DICVIV_03912 [Dictyocaulus viviparus]